MNTIEKQKLFSLIDDFNKTYSRPRVTKNKSHSPVVFNTLNPDIDDDLSDESVTSYTNNIASSSFEQWKKLIADVTKKNDLNTILYEPIKKQIKYYSEHPAINNETQVDLLQYFLLNCNQINFNICHQALAYLLAGTDLSVENISFSKSEIENSNNYSALERFINEKFKASGKAAYSIDLAGETLYIFNYNTNSFVTNYKSDDDHQLFVFAPKVFDKDSPALKFLKMIQDQYIKPKLIKEVKTCQTSLFNKKNLKNKTNQTFIDFIMHCNHLCKHPICDFSHNKHININAQLPQSSHYPKWSTIQLATFLYKRGQLRINFLYMLLENESISLDQVFAPSKFMNDNYLKGLSLAHALLLPTDYDRGQKSRYITSFSHSQELINFFELLSKNKSFDFNKKCDVNLEISGFSITKNLTLLNLSILLHNTKYHSCLSKFDYYNFIEYLIAKNANTAIKTTVNNISINSLELATSIGNPNIIDLITRRLGRTLHPLFEPESIVNSIEEFIEHGKQNFYSFYNTKDRNNLDNAIIQLLRLPKDFFQKNKMAYLKYLGHIDQFTGEGSYRMDLNRLDLSRFKIQGWRSHNFLPLRTRCLYEIVVRLENETLSDNEIPKLERNVLIDYMREELINNVVSYFLTKEHTDLLKLKKNEIIFKVQTESLKKIDDIKEKPHYTLLEEVGKYKITRQLKNQKNYYEDIELEKIPKLKALIHNLNDVSNINTETLTKIKGALETYENETRRYQLFADRMAGLIGDLKQDQSICFPGGWKGHAVFINFIAINGFIMIRIDNLGEGVSSLKLHPVKKEGKNKSYQPYIVALISKKEFIDNKEEINAYLQNCISAKKDEHITGAEKIYAINKPYSNKFQNSRKNNLNKNKFPFKGVFRGGICVEKNHSIGVEIRLIQPSYIPEDQTKIYEWYKKYERSFAVRLKNDQKKSVPKLSKYFMFVDLKKNAPSEKNNNKNIRKIGEIDDKDKVEENPKKKSKI